MKRENPLLPSMCYVVAVQALDGSWRDCARFVHLGDAANYVVYVGRRYRGDTYGCAWRVRDRKKRCVALTFEPEVAEDDKNGAA